MQQAIESAFVKIFKKNADSVIFSPGRANIIGEHTDYNEGFVLPFAIQYGIWFAFSPNPKGEHNIFSYNENEYLHLNFHNLDHNLKGWKKFFVQVLKNISFSFSHGVDLVFGGDLPIGAGISSSSALTCGWVTVLYKTNNLELIPHALLDVAVTSERGYGVQGGIMDQYTIINATRGNCIMLDCRNNTAEYIPLPQKNCHFYLINTMIKHHLVDTEYNQRRQECLESIAIIKKSLPHINSLRDTKLDDLDILGSYPTLHSRAQFVIEENTRVLDIVKYLKEGDLSNLGSLLYQSHKGLSQLYEVSCEELDYLVEISYEIPELLGSRMMGGGFGGCTINFANKPLSEHSLNKIKSIYSEKFQREPEIYKVQTEAGIIENSKHRH